MEWTMLRLPVQEVKPAAARSECEMCERDPKANRDGWV